MIDTNLIAEGFLDPIIRVVEQMLEQAPDLDPSQVMLVVDLLPFGELEDPEGVVRPPQRDDGIPVWAFSEIFDSSQPLPLHPSLTIRCPTVPGYTAAKLAAWLDRSEMARGEGRQRPRPEHVLVRGVDGAWQPAL